MKDLFDVCLHNSCHYMIFQNSEIFLKAIEKIDKNYKKDLLVLEAIIKSISNGNREVKI